MEDTANSNAGLMRRIVQLEQEKEELHRDIESLCMQQSGVPGSIDIVSRMQSRRASGAEQELEACKQKLALQSRENLNLQEELTEIKCAKGRVADAFKAAMDKNKELEKEVKFYQSRMTGSFNERDKAVLEVEKIQAKETEMTKELRDLHGRLKQTKTEFEEQEINFKELQQSMEESMFHLARLQKVVGKFWRIRESAKENGYNDEASMDRAQVLLEDNDADWVYAPVSDGMGANNLKTLEVALAQVKEEQEHSKVKSAELQESLSKEQAASAKLEYELALSELASTKLKDELKSVKAESTEVKILLEKENLARMDAQDIISMVSDQLALKHYTLTRDLHRLQVQQVGLKTMVSAFQEAEKRQVFIVQESLKVMAEKLKSEVLQQKTGPEVEEPNSSSIQKVKENSERVHSESNGTSHATEKTKEQNDLLGLKAANISLDDSKEILAQALKEKVEALLLLSQQEERYYLEAATQSALGSQMTELKEKLGEATIEKVKALLDLAEERKQIQQLKGREKELIQWLEQRKIVYPGVGQANASLPEAEVSSSDGGSSTIPVLQDKPLVGSKQQIVTSRGFLKGWLRGLDISALTTSRVAVSSTTATDVIQTPKSENGDIGSSSAADVTQDNKSDNGDVARLSTDTQDAALPERIANIQNIAQSAHRLRKVLEQVCRESFGEHERPSIQSAIEIVDSVKADAKQLSVELGSTFPVRLGSSLPVSFEGTTESSLQKSSEEILEADHGHVGATHDLDPISMIGMEIIELLLAAAELQAQSLQARLNSESTGE